MDNTLHSSFLLSSRVFTKSCAFFQMFFQIFKAFCSFDSPFSSIRKKYRSFATVHYTVFVELKQFKAFCAVTDTHTHTHCTDRLVSRSQPLLRSSRGEGLATRDY